MLSRSLLRYIENTYGKENMLDIYYTGQFEEVLGKSFEEIKNEWIDYVKSI